MMYICCRSEAIRIPLKKQRILGKKGHLSNELSGGCSGEVLRDHFLLSFLDICQEENNYAELAYETVRLEVAMGR